VGDDVGANDLAPGLELLDRGGAEGIAGGDDHLLAVLAVGLGELRDAGGLAGAVDADDEDDVGARGWRRLLLAPDAAFLAAGVEDADKLLLEEIADDGGVVDTVLLDVELEVAEDLLGGDDARIGADEELFELVPDLVVDLAAVEEDGDVAEPALAGAFESLFGLLVGLFGALEDTEQRGTSLPPGSLSDGGSNHRLYRWGECPSADDTDGANGMDGGTISTGFSTQRTKDKDGFGRQLRGMVAEGRAGDAAVRIVQSVATLT
jgi:hypothetical protein